VLALKDYMLTYGKPDKIKMPLNTPIFFDGILFILTEKGEVVLNISSERVTLKSNSIFTIMPHYLVEVVYISDDYNGNVQFFSMDYMMDFFFTSEIEIPLIMESRPLLEVSGRELNDVIKHHYFILDKLDRSHSYKEKIICKLLHTFILEVGGLYTKRLISKNGIMSVYNQKLVGRFFRLLITNLDNRRNIAFYADKLCLTPKYVSSLITKYTGKSVQTWINYFSTLYAKYLLRSTSLTITQISDKLGFPNPSFFGRFIKQQLGITPGKYRDINNMRY